MQGYKSIAVFDEITPDPTTELIAKGLKFITENSGEIFEILKQSVLFDNLFKYSQEDTYYSKEPMAAIPESNSSPIVSTYTSYAGINYYSYERSIGTYVTYANGEKLYKSLPLSSLAYTKLSEYVLG